MDGFDGWDDHDWGWGGWFFSWFPIFIIFRLLAALFDERRPTTAWPTSKAPPAGAPAPPPQPQSPGPASAPRPMLQCVNCQKNISADYAYCPHCGHDPRRRAVCAYCGTPHKLGRTNCESCGAPVR